MEKAFVNLAREFHASLPHTKRFLERWMADPTFRQRLGTDPSGTMQAYKLQADPERLRPLFDRAAAEAAGQDLAEEVRQYRDFIVLKHKYRDRIRDSGAPAHPDFRRWRRRQMLRAHWDLGPARVAGLVHPPVCFELSKGCTVKCWFCGIGALPFEGAWPYSPDNAALWQSALGTVRELCGEAAGNGFCYWGTDPLDNPDYEKFILDFRRLLGKLPQTTTAMGHKDPQRTRALLKLAAENDGFVERFSVLSLGLFNRIMEEFTAEELLCVELVQQFHDTESTKALAGAGRERALRKHAEKNVPLPENIEDGGTIACVSGFLFNMVERSVKLISPCSANARWPLGYIVFHEFCFRDAEDLKQKLADTVRDHMSQTVTINMPMRFNSCFRIEYLEAGFKLSSPYYVITLDRFAHGADLGRRIAAGDQTVGEIAEGRLAELGVDPVDTLQDLSTLLNDGLLAEEPAAPAVAEQLVTVRTPRPRAAAPAPV